MSRYTKYEDIPFTAEQWQLIKTAIDDDIDIEDIANHRFTVEQLEVLIKAKKDKVDIEAIKDPEIPAKQMNAVLEHIMRESGTYEAHYESVRRKWLKNITWMIILITLVVVAIFFYYGNRDWIEAYTDELILEIEQEVEIEAGELFQAADYIHSYTLSANLILPDVNTNIPGTQYVEYKIENGVKTESKQLKLRVVDTTAPIIQLTQEYLKLTSPDAFSCKNYLLTATDSLDGDLSDKVICTGMDPSATHQEISYTVSDEAGNQTTAILIVDIERETISQKNPDIAYDQVPEFKDNQEIIVTAQNKVYLVQEGISFDELHAQCRADGEMALAKRQASGFSCEPIPDSAIAGLFIGYSLNFR